MNKHNYMQTGEKMDKCYSVSFSTGEYDCSESVIFFTPFEGQAKIFVEKANEWLMENGLHYDNNSRLQGYSDNEYQDELVFPDWLPIRRDYTGGSFSYNEKPLIFDVETIIAENKKIL